MRGVARFSGGYLAPLRSGPSGWITRTTEFLRVAPAALTTQTTGYPPERYALCGALFRGITCSATLRPFGLDCMDSAAS